MQAGKCTAIVFLKQFSFYPQGIKFFLQMSKTSFIAKSLARRRRKRRRIGGGGHNDLSERFRNWLQSRLWVFVLFFWCNHLQPLSVTTRLCPFHIKSFLSMFYLNFMNGLSETAQPTSVVVDQTPQGQRLWLSSAPLPNILQQTSFQKAQITRENYNMVSQCENFFTTSQLTVNCFL